MLILILLAASLAASPRLGSLPAADVDALLRELQASRLSFAERIARVSERFVGTRYVRDPLGEGKGAPVDPDPLIDLGRVDCLTFVEQVLALAQRPSLEEATALLQRYRYENGRVSYERRRHFMELQWFPGLARQGLLRDITRAVGGDAVRAFERKVGERSYRGSFREWRRKLGQALPQGRIRLDYVLARAAPSRAGRIAPGTIMALLRRTPRSWPITITHVGFVVRRGDALVFRHAIRRAGRVIDERLERYLARHARDKRSLGFHFAEPLLARGDAARLEH
jgi:D-alanyl-D-alanine carboxypeptidase/D-alanyl-D-alanine-endopeptidase (penicillin-binding protein 4)